MPLQFTGMVVVVVVVDVDVDVVVDVVVDDEVVEVELEDCDEDGAAIDVLEEDGDVGALGAALGELSIPADD